MRGQKYDENHRSIVVDPATQIIKAGQKKASVDE